jgi:hypothetical protein
MKPGAFRFLDHIIRAASVLPPAQHTLLKGQHSFGGETLIWCCWLSASFLLDALPVITVYNWLSAIGTS